MKKVLFALIFFLFGSCHESKYFECNEMMGTCLNDNSSYCHVGFKFESVRQGKHQITYSFCSAGKAVNTHSDDDQISLDFKSLIPCAKEEIRNALKAYEGIGNMEFQELTDNQKADIRFSVADMRQQRSAVAYPNFSDLPCKDISGSVIINSQIKGYDCKSFYSLMLHEIGHALGLGHVASQNIMNPKSNLKFMELQMGDSLGITDLYGKR